MIQSQIITGMQRKDMLTARVNINQFTGTMLRDWGPPIFHEMDADHKHKNIN